MRLTRRSLGHISRISAAVAIGAALTGLPISTAWAATPLVKVKLETSMGNIVLELDAERAPKTVENFVDYVKSGHYDGTVFHRVINNFMVQGGGFDEKLVQKSTRMPITHEGRQALEKGGMRNVIGTVAMARSNDPNSATAQFFINVKDNAFLDPVLIPPGDPVPKFEYQGKTYENVPRANLMNAPQLFGYTVFGKVIAGMDVVNAIKEVPTGGSGMFPTDVPKTPIIIRKATLEK